MLTQETLKKLLHYDPETGVFTRLVRTANRVQAGDIAGCIGNGYVWIGVYYKLYSAHRLAFLYMTGSFPPKHIDHINHIGSDNRWDNLRAVTHQENHKNCRRSFKNTSGVTGVYWNKANENWRARIYVDDKDVDLGSFGSLFEAACARKSAENKYNFHRNHGAKIAEIREK